MHTSTLRARLLVVISATGLASLGLAACGSESGTSSNGPVDAAGELGADAPTDSPSQDSTPQDSGATDARGDESIPTVRRPFLVGASLRSAPREARLDWASSSLAKAGPLVDPRLDPTTAHELARVWLADALEEHASIAAFARFTMLLLSVGAPPELVVGAQRASLDEVAHARDCFALAHRYSGEAVGPGALEVHDTLGRLTLAELAALTTEEGCVGETLGVALATEQLALAEDPVVRRILGRIVRDEARHAELAWRFVAWAIGEERRGGEQARGVSQAVARAAEHAVRVTRAMTIRQPPADIAAWHAHGRLACAEARAISERAIQEVLGPCLAALGVATRTVVPTSPRAPLTSPG